ncbi:MAG: hypothetical protein ACLKAK_00870 [Alkaliphilus sp.]
MSLERNCILLVLLLLVIFSAVAFWGVKHKKYFMLVAFSIFFVIIMQEIYVMYEFRAYERIFISDRIEIKCLRSNNTIVHATEDLLNEVGFSVITHRNFSSDIEMIEKVVTVNRFTIDEFKQGIRDVRLRKFSLFLAV